MLMGLVVLFLFLFTVVLCCIFIVRFGMFILKKKPFPKKLSAFCLAGIVTLLIISGYQTYFFTFDETKGNINQEPVESPNGTYTAVRYDLPYGGAAGGVNVRVQVRENGTNNDPGTVYFADAKRQFQLEWEDNSTLKVTNKSLEYPDSNRSVELDVEDEVYHETGRACKSWLLKDEYDTCYQHESS
ncbi:DUF5412 family protein [Salibacterium qingdaonense]|uniref:Uncharacterized protein n=1 Tax=Salibacterium qingdaonense TaxID=266892 RepID=A0A1I4QHV3_9BACI|nr:DUF5412 family protein [Salibacterium qingdaonense]SFM39265.1 hypothetical protein SAMN04488054_14219 [Salibacterium qingdaonense]